MRFAVIDFQAFTGVGAGYIVKELSAVDIDTLNEEYYVFKPPKDLPLQQGRSESDKWLENHFHKLDPKQGDHEYFLLEKILRRLAKKYWFLFAKGLEKCVFIENETQHPVYDLLYFGCPSVRELTKNAKKCVDCPNHREKETVCSRLQARVLAGWANENKYLIDLTDPRVRINTFTRWASAQDPVRLANLGFVHIIGSGKGIRCVFCNYEILKTTYKVDPQKEHIKFSPDCPTLKSNV